MKRLLWCNSHQREASECDRKSGITLPCMVVDLTDKVTIFEDDVQIYTPKLWIQSKGVLIEDKYHV